MYRSSHLTKKLSMIEIWHTARELRHASIKDAVHLFVDKVEIERRGLLDIRNHQEGSKFFQIISQN